MYLNQNVQYSCKVLSDSAEIYELTDAEFAKMLKWQPTAEKGLRQFIEYKLNEFKSQLQLSGARMDN